MPRLLAFVLVIASTGVLSGCCSSSTPLGGGACEANLDRSRDAAKVGWRNARNPPPKGLASPPKLRKGMLMADVREKLGEPDEASERGGETVWRYEAGKGKRLDVRFRDGKVTRWDEATYTRSS